MTSALRLGIFTDNFRYKAFISYSWADRAWSEWFHRALETYRPPKEAADGQTLRPIFKDREEDAAHASIGAAIETALGDSEFLIVLCSPRSAASKWVNREVAWFKTNRDPKKILAVIIDGEPLASQVAGRESQECFPASLLYKINADLLPTDVLEDPPLAADARKVGDGKRGAKLKLAAAMLGVGYDALARRDDRRRSKRRRLVMSAMAASIAVLAGIAIYALNQRNAAIVARDDAQGLVEFMLTDLRQRLDAVGRLDVLDAVAKRLLDSYAKEDLLKLDPDALGRRARVLMLLGEVDSARGNLDAALARYKEAVATTEELLRRNPDDEQRIFDHAQSIYWVGDIAWKRGDIATVTDYWTQYRDFGARLVAINPDKDAWQTELGYGHRNLATLALQEGDAGAAAEGFERARDVSQRLAEADPADRSLQIILADDLAWLAIAQERLGDFAEAERTLATEAAIYAALLARDPSDDAILNRQSVNGRVAARIAMDVGDAEHGLAMLQALFDLHESRLAHDSENTRWLDYYGLLQIETGSALLALGNHGAAREMADGALAVARRLRSIDDSVTDWAIDNHCGALLLAARAAFAEGDERAADAHLDEAEAVIMSVSAGKAPPGLDKPVIRTALMRARLAERAGDSTAARHLAADAAAKIDALITKSGFEYKTVFIETYLLAGDMARARALAAVLDAVGYRHADWVTLRKQVLRSQGGVETAARPIRQTSDRRY